HGARVNLCACLGVGPGHRLLLGPVTPTAAYDRASAPPLATPVRMGEVGTPRPAYRRRPRRSREEARLLYARVKAKVEAGMEAKRDQYEVRDEIAESEGIERSYVDFIVSKLKLARGRRRPDEIKQLVARALKLIGENPRWTKRRVAAELGVDECYLHVA